MAPGPSSGVRGAPAARLRMQPARRRGRLQQRLKSGGEPKQTRQILDYVPCELALHLRSIVALESLPEPQPPFPPAAPPAPPFGYHVYGRLATAKMRPEKGPTEAGRRCWARSVPVPEKEGISSKVKPVP